MHFEIGSLIKELFKGKGGWGYMSELYIGLTEAILWIYLNIFFLLQNLKSN